MLRSCLEAGLHELIEGAFSEVVVVVTAVWCVAPQIEVPATEAATFVTQKRNLSFGVTPAPRRRKSERSAA